MKGTIKFIDLFAGIGGIRCGLELAAHEAGYKTECVFTSEIKKHAIKVLKQNHPNELINGDITQVNEKEIPDFEHWRRGRRTGKNLQLHHGTVVSYRGREQRHPNLSDAKHV